MEHLASEIGMDPLEFRMKNLITQGERLFTKPYSLLEANPLLDIIDSLKRTAEYDTRMAAVETFNTKNKWKKRGLSMVPTLYTQDATGSTFYFTMSIFQGDGTIAISHGGVELGNVRQRRFLSVLEFNRFAILCRE